MLHKHKTSFSPRVKLIQDCNRKDGGYSLIEGLENGMERPCTKGLSSIIAGRFIAVAIECSFLCLQTRSSSVCELINNLNTAIESVEWALNHTWNASGLGGHEKMRSFKKVCVDECIWAQTSQRSSISVLNKREKSEGERRTKTENLTWASKASECQRFIDKPGKKNRITEQWNQWNSWFN